MLPFDHRNPCRRRGHRFRIEILEPRCNFSIDGLDASEGILRDVLPSESDSKETPSEFIDAAHDLRESTQDEVFQEPEKEDESLDEPWEESWEEPWDESEIDNEMRDATVLPDDSEEDVLIVLDNDGYDQDGYEEDGNEDQFEELDIERKDKNQVGSDLSLESNTGGTESLRVIPSSVNPELPLVRNKLSFAPGPPIALPTSLPALEKLESKSWLPSVMSVSPLSMLGVSPSANKLSEFVDLGTLSSSSNPASSSFLELLLPTNVPDRWWQTPLELGQPRSVQAVPSKTSKWPVPKPRQAQVKDMILDITQDVTHQQHENTFPPRATVDFPMEKSKGETRVESPKTHPDGGPPVHDVSRVKPAQSHDTDLVQGSWIWMVETDWTNSALYAGFAFIWVPYLVVHSYSIRSQESSSC